MLSLNFEKNQTITATSKFHEQTNQNSLKKNTNATKNLSPSLNSHKFDAPASQDSMITNNLRPKRKFPNENSYSDRNLNEEKNNSASRKATISTPKLTNTSTSAASTLNNHVNVISNSSPPVSVNSNSLTKKPKVLINDEYCNYCYEGGNILNCDRCPASFHFLCHDPPLNFDDIPAGEFLCNKCKSNAICNKSNEHSSDINLIHFFKVENESPLKTLTRMSKSFNPKQMFFPIEFNRNLNVNIPGLNKIEWLYENHSNTKTYQPLNLELLYFLSLKSINYSPKSFTTQIAQNQFKDINTLNQLANSGANLNGSIYSSKVFNTAASRNENGQGVGNGCSNGNVCFICQNNVKFEKLAQCDFCLLSYHLDCLNPPLCEVPAREKFWMCPSHVEHILDKLFPKTNRLTDRIKLWNLYTSITCNTDDTKYEFIKKINIEKQREPIETSQFSNYSQLKRCKIPPEIKKVYSKRKSKEKISYSNKQKISQSNESIQLIFENRSENNIESNISSQSSSESDFSEDEDDDESKTKNSKTTLLTSFRQMHLESGLRPKALFLVLNENILKLKHLGYENLNIISLAENEDLLFVPFSSNRHSITIGNSEKMDFVIDKKFLNSITRTRRCKCISENHARVNYDILTNNFELVNYSKYGTLVDDFYYGLDVENENHEKISKYSKCKCRKKILANKPILEGAARLKNGSVLSIGCLSFLFIIFDSCESKVLNSIAEYKQLKRINENLSQENELIKLKWKNKEKSLANKKDLLSMCSSKIKFKLKDENKRELFD